MSHTNMTDHQYRVEVLRLAHKCLLKEMSESSIDAHVRKWILKGQTAFGTGVQFAQVPRPTIEPILQKIVQDIAEKTQKMRAAVTKPAYYKLHWRGHFLTYCDIPSLHYANEKASEFQEIEFYTLEGAHDARFAFEKENRLLGFDTEDNDLDNVQVFGFSKTHQFLTEY